VKIERLHFEGCSHREAVERSLRDRRGAAGFAARVDLVEVRDPADAGRRRFPGSPRLRLDGHEAEPGAYARCDFGMKCRLYRTAGTLAGVPSQALVRAALVTANAA
jgi:hypothetical protein